MSDLVSRDRSEVRIELPNPLVRRLAMFRSAYDRLMLAWHLLRDERVSYWAKAIPILTIAYLVSPVDFLPAVVAGPLGLLDDVTILILGLNWFIQSVPAEIISEHLESLGLGL